MIKIGREHLIIIILSLLLAVILIFPEAGNKEEKQAVFAESEDNSYYPKLIAPDRNVIPIKEGTRVCYLTFDDGPSENTEKVLDILAKYHIKATFFVIGESLTEERRATVQRVIEEGHTIGMHANVHEYEHLYASLDSFLSDYETLYDKLKEDYGIETAIFRFPGGSVCNCLGGQGKYYIQEMQKRGFYCFDWNVSGEDSVGSPTVASIQKNVLSKGLDCRRAIVLLHDSKMAVKTVEALPAIIESFQKEGFEFQSLENAENYVFPASRF